MTIDVTFFTKWEELPEAMPPVPATKFWPEWFKKQRNSYYGILSGSYAHAKSL